MPANTSAPVWKRARTACPSLQIPLLVIPPRTGPRRWLFLHQFLGKKMGNRRCETACPSLLDVTSSSYLLHFCLPSSTAPSRGCNATIASPLRAKPACSKRERAFLKIQIFLGCAAAERKATLLPLLGSQGKPVIGCCGLHLRFRQSILTCTRHTS